MSEIDLLPGHLVRRLHQISVARFTARMAEAGLDLTSVQFAALVALRDHAGSDQRTLAGRIAYDRVTIGAVIDRLVRKGLVSRDRSTQDRRARTLALTDAGRAMIDAARPWVDRVQDDLVGLLSPAERDGFVATLARIAQAGNDQSRSPLRPAPTTGPA